MKLQPLLLAIYLSLSSAAVVEKQDDVVRGGGSVPVVGMPGGDSFCTAAAPCSAGDGDCDFDNECRPGLGCGYNNCIRQNGPGLYVEGQDCCEASQVGHFSFCSGKQCAVGEGDCDSDAECGPGLGCGSDNCRAMNPDIANTINPDADCCEPLRPGHATYCENAAGRCGIGQGGCTANDHCAPGLQCVVCTHPNLCCKCQGELSTAATPSTGFVHNLHPVQVPLDGLENVPAQFFGGESRGSVQPVPAETGLDLHCCGPESCSFFIVLYHCPPCSNSLNGGFTADLLQSGWAPGSCSPTVSGYRSVTYHKVLTPGTSEKFTLTNPALFLYTFSKVVKDGDDKWCPERTFKPQGPHSPPQACVCPER